MNKSTNCRPAIDLPHPPRSPRRADSRVSMLRRPIASLFAGLALFAPSAWAASAAPVGGENGMVVSAHRLASQVGIDVLKSGGNAVDAAVAVGYALAVVYPGAGNLGGGGFMTVRMADGRQSFLDFRERAPLAATRDMYLGADGQVVKGLSTRGQLAVAVPGTVSGLEAARGRFGSLPRPQLVDPAIRLAREGFELDAGDAAMLAVATEDLRRDEDAVAIFLDHGQPLVPGQRLVQTQLARTLERIRDQGTDGFYRGPVAQALVVASRSGHGLITQADLDRYRTRELAPVECDYRGFHVISAPPPSSGGVVLCEMLEVLAGYPLAEWGFRSARAVAVQIEAMRHAYVDRNALLGDPDFVASPIAHLLDPAYAAAIRAAIPPGKAIDSRAIVPGQAEPGARPGSGQAPHEGSNTTHYSVIDRWGNAVAVTYTLNDWFGARVMARGTGVMLNDEMDDFTSKPGVANLYGLVQGEANAIAPGKTPLSSMTPTIVTRDGQPAIVLGTPGGSRIITTVLLTLLNLIDYRMTVQEAVDEPRFHHQALPDKTFLERFALSPDTQRMLEAEGYVFGDSPPAAHVAAILAGAPALGARPVGRERYFGANDPRRGTGAAIGY